jgi:GLPGLI family protein
MKKTVLIFLFCFIAYNLTAQAPVMVGDCTVTYAVSGGDAGTNKNLAGTTKTFYVKGKMSRVDLNSETGKAVILKEVGSEKYKSIFTAEQWKIENKRFEGVKIVTTNEKKTILDYDCKKVIATLKDGSSYTMYCATTITPSTQENPYQFKDVPGFVLQYETSSGTSAAKITFTASVINFSPVPASKFEIPSTGYRLLE